MGKYSGIRISIQYLYNSIVHTLVTVPAQMLLGLLTALFINSISHFRIGFRVLYYLPVLRLRVIASWFSNTCLIRREC